MGNKKEYLDGQGLARLAEDLEVRHPSIFVGTKDEWNNLTTDEKSKSVLVCLTDDL